MSLDLVEGCAALAVALPGLALLVIGGAAMLGLRMSERIIGSVTKGAMVLSSASLLASLTAFLSSGAAPRGISVLPGDLARSLAFAIELHLDTVSLLFSTVAVFICAVSAAFSDRYLHREPGYGRYFLLLNTFVVGILLVSLAGSVSLLFAGWEFLGISSSLLVAFFHERPAPLRSALRVFTVYRLSDAAMLSAAILVHHELGSGRLELLFSRGAHSGSALPASTATVVALLLTAAAMGKCAQLPFSDWIPRAMEGPTPSSAVFYGALSVHAGAFVLLRSGPILEQAPVARALIITIGLATALFATLSGRVQTDVKTALAFASLTQVSLILVEIGLGLYALALLHMAGHASVRLLQFLRAPSILHDLHEATNAVGGHLGRTGAHLERLLPKGLRSWLYRFALERGYLGATLDRFVVVPYVRTSKLLNRIERSWCALLAGDRPSSGAPSAIPELDDD